MTPKELADILFRMYDNASENEATTMIRLFGIKYADAIRDCGASVSEIVRLSSLSNSYATEVYKGVRLARYVVPRSGSPG